VVWTLSSSFLSIRSRSSHSWRILRRAFRPRRRWSWLVLASIAPHHQHMRQGKMCRREKQTDGRGEEIIRAVESQCSRCWRSWAQGPGSVARPRKASAPRSAFYTSEPSFQTAHTLMEICVSLYDCWISVQWCQGEEGWSLQVPRFSSSDEITEEYRGPIQLIGGATALLRQELSFASF
jgi:hypothetical protein